MGNFWIFDECLCQNWFKSLAQSHKIPVSWRFYDIFDKISFKLILQQKHSSTKIDPKGIFFYFLDSIKHSTQLLFIYTCTLLLKYMYNDVLSVNTVKNVIALY